MAEAWRKRHASARGTSVATRESGHPVTLSAFAAFAGAVPRTPPRRFLSAVAYGHTLLDERCAVATCHAL